MVRVTASALKLENTVVKGPLEDVMWFWACADAEIRAVSRAAVWLSASAVGSCFCCLLSVCPWSSTSYCSCRICSHSICRIIRI